MAHQNRGQMEFYFPLQDKMYHWVRSSSLYSPAARQRQITVKTMFRQEEIGVGVPVFDRMETGFYFRKLHSLCLSAGVPYLVDLDDLFWDLPGYSVSSHIPAKYLLAFPEKLISGAAALTVSTHELKEHVERRYPGKPVFLVENCPPAWVAPRSGALIANTDAFKMGDHQIQWFIDLLRLIFEHGLSIQLLGENQNLFDQCTDIVVHSIEVFGRSYLLNLAQSNYRLALIPVEQSSYADCKSAIKAFDFVSQGIPTVASDIAPYRRFAGQYGISDFHVVANSLEAWKPAVETIILQVPEDERRRGKKINAMLKTARDTQFQQWLAVIDFLHDRRPDAATMRRLCRKLRPYRFAYSKIRPVFMPIKSLLQRRS
jgi:hypothetical protein